MGELRAAAIKAGADTQYSATEAAHGITEMAKAGVSAKDIMGGGLTGALSLAAAGQLDVADAAGIASTAMTQFSLSGSQTPARRRPARRGCGQGDGVRR
jgi:TP901 family phage tail tape measure protein